MPRPGTSLPRIRPVPRRAGLRDGCFTGIGEAPTPSRRVAPPAQLGQRRPTIDTTPLHQDRQRDGLVARGRNGRRAAVDGLANADGCGCSRGTNRRPRRGVRPGCPEMRWRGTGARRRGGPASCRLGNPSPSHARVPRNLGPPTDHDRDTYPAESGALRGAERASAFRGERVRHGDLGCGRTSCRTGLGARSRRSSPGGSGGEAASAFHGARAAVRGWGWCVLGSRSSVCLLAGRAGGR
jgi:hypothetical protein